MIVSEKNKDLKLIKNRFFSSEKRRNSGNCTYDIMLTRSSEKIFKPMRYTSISYIYDYAHLFFGEDF